MVFPSLVKAQALFYKCDNTLSQSNFVYDIKKVDNGYIYIANDRGLLASDGAQSWYVFQKDGIFPREILINNGIYLRLNTGDTVSLYPEDIDFSKSIYTNTNQKIDIEFSTKEVKIKSRNFNQIFLAKQFENYTDFAIDNTKNIWLASDKNLYLNVYGESNIQAIKVGDNHQKVGINCIEIIDNHLWLGTNGYGIYYINLSNYFFSIAQSQNFEPIGAAKDKLFTLNENGIITTHTLQYFNSYSQALTLGKNIINAQIINEQLFVVYSNKVSIVNTDGKVIESMPFKNFKANGTVALFQGNIYLGSNAQGILSIGSNNNQKIINTSNGLLHNQVLGFSQSKQRLLAYSTKGGISDVIDKDKYIDYQNNGLQGNVKHIAYINNEWWVSTEGFGVKIFNKNLKYTGSIDQNSVLTSPYVLAVSNFGKKTLGIQPRDFFILENNQSKNVSPTSYQSDVYFDGNYALINDEKIVFGTNIGLLQYFEATTNNTNEINIQISATELNGYPIDIDPPFGSSNNVKIYFEAIIPSPLYRDFELYYTLEGDDLRKEAIDSKSIEIKDLSYGNYSLKIFKANGSLIANHNFTIEKAIYLKPVFWIAIALVLTLVVMVIIYWRTSAVKKQNEELEKKIKERTSEIQKKSKLLEQISFTLSHDLKTPAHNVIELAKMLNNRMPETKKFAKMFEDAGGQILLKTLDTLEILRSDSALEAEKVNCNILELIEKSIKPLQFQIEKKEALININCSENTSILLNKSQWQSVFFNLISNALKYSKDDSICQINIEVQTKENAYTISVKDNGIGMDTNKLNLFEKFESGTSNSTSTGVGLSLVKQIIESHGGSIKVESKLGIGSNFIIHLPS